MVRKERGVFENVPGSGIWWIRFKVQRRRAPRGGWPAGDEMKLYAMGRVGVVRSVKMPANMKHKGVKFSEIAQEAVDWHTNHER